MLVINLNASSVAKSRGVNDCNFRFANLHFIFCATTGFWSHFSTLLVLQFLFIKIFTVFNAVFGLHGVLNVTEEVQKGSFTLPCAAQQQNFIVCLDSVIGVFPNLGYDTHSWIFLFFSALFCFVPHFVAHLTVRGLLWLNFWFFFLSSLKLPFILLTFRWCYKLLSNPLQQLQLERIISGARLTEHFKQFFKVFGRIL